MAEDWLDKALDGNDKASYDSFEDWAADESNEYAKTSIPDDARNYPQLHFIKGLARIPPLRQVEDEPPFDIMIIKEVIT